MFNVTNAIYKMHKMY